MIEDGTFHQGVDCRSVVVGDIVTRRLAGVVPMQLRVTSVDDTLLYCGPWTFDRDTGAEVDEDLGWGPTPGTGSMIVGWESA